MSRAIRKALDFFNGVVSPSPSPGGTGGPPTVPPPRNLPGPTTPDVPAGRSGWGAALGAGAALAAGGGILGAAINAINGSNAPQPPAPPPSDPKPPQPQGPVDPNDVRKARIQAQSDALSRRQYMRTMANRYKDQIAKNPKIYEDMMAAYDGAQVPTDRPQISPEGINRNASARAFAARALVDHLDAQKTAQIGLNVQNQAKQQNVARQMGVDRGYVMAMEDVQRHAANGDIASASAAAAMYSQRYGPGFLYAAKNMTDQHAASERSKAEIAGQKPPPQTVAQSVSKNMAEIQAMPPGPARKAAIEQFYSAGANGDPKAAKAGVENHYQTIVKDMGTRLGNLSPEETSELQQVAGHMNYQQFLKYSGAVDNADTQQNYQRIFNKNATWAQSNEQLGPLGTIRDWMVPDFIFPGWK